MKNRPQEGQAIAAARTTSKESPYPRDRVIVEGDIPANNWNGLDNRLRNQESVERVTGTRCRAEEFFQDGKTHLGMAAYEARSWRSWHHHMSLVALAHIYVTLTKRDMRRDLPELTLDMAVRVLRSAFARSDLTEHESIHLIDYHLHRNHVAHESHRKSWLRKHKRCKTSPFWPRSVVLAAMLSP